MSDAPLAELIRINIVGDIEELALMLRREAQNPTGPNRATVALVAHKLDAVAAGVREL